MKDVSLTEIIASIVMLIIAIFTYCYVVSPSNIDQSPQPKIPAVVPRAPIHYDEYMDGKG